MDHESLVCRAGRGDVRAFVELTRRFRNFAFGSALFVGARFPANGRCGPGSIHGGVVGPAYLRRSGRVSRLAADDRAAPCLSCIAAQASSDAPANSGG